MADRPNVLIIIVDQMRADMIGRYGNPFCRTPNIDSLAEAGTRFTRAYCPFPQCSPTRASLMTGLWPLKTGIGIQSNYRMFGEHVVEKLRRDIPTIGTLFRNAGYRTGYVGKWHLSESTWEPATDLAEYGFDHYDGSAPHLKDLRMQGSGGQLYTRGIVGRGRATEDWDGSPANRIADFIRDASAADRPFLAVYSDPRPHPPYVVTDEDFQRFAPDDPPLWPNTHDDMSQKPRAHQRWRQNLMGDDPIPEEYWKAIIRHYAALIAAADRDIGRVLTALDETGTADNTLVVFLSDHGDTAGAHGLISKGIVCCEELIRIPLIVRWPGTVAADATRDELIEVMDILPTLAAAAGIDAPEECDGRDLTALLRGRTPGDWREHVFVMHHGNGYGLCTTRVVLTDRWKYVYYPYDIGELYDLHTDPWEMTNLIDDPSKRDTVEHMHQRLIEHTRTTGDRFNISPRPGVSR